MSEQCVVGEHFFLKIAFFTAVVNNLNLLQWWSYFKPAFVMIYQTSSRAAKGRRGPFSAAMFINVETYELLGNPEFGIACNFWNKAARVLNPRFVCFESQRLQNMPITAWSIHGKALTFEDVFLGFSLHHLFMHMNIFGHQSALLGLARSKRVISRVQ